MTIDQLHKILKENNINESNFQIYPKYIVEGALALTKEDDSWTIQRNERGEWVLNEKFWTESEALKFFLKKVLSEPTYRNDFKNTDLIDWPITKTKLLEKYGLAENSEQIAQPDSQ